MKIALVHDDFMQWGGAERVFYRLMQLYPDAPVYTLAYNKSSIPNGFPLDRVHVSFFQKWPFKALFNTLFFLHPMAFERMNFNEFDVVISSSTRFAKSIVTQPKTKHIAYINSPPRFLWPASTGFGPRQYIDHFVKRSFILLRPLIWVFLRPIILLLRLHDFSAAQRIDHIVGNSKNVAARVKKFYRRDAHVIYPFAELERFINEELVAVGEYYLIISRLASHKQVDLAIQACNRLNLPLKIIGTGPERTYLESIAGDNVEFLGFVSDEDVVGYIKNCKAFIYPQEEDFGITALEAQALGKPVIAYNRGGAVETVEHKRTGMFFEPQTIDALVETLHKFEQHSFDATYIREHAKKFSRERFDEEITQLVHIVNAEA